MEELPEYQICPKCGKRSTPYMDKCWNCGESFYLDLNEEFSENSAGTPPAEDNRDFEPEKISPCTLDGMNFTDKMFAYSLLFRGEMILEFCGCDICEKAFRDVLAFFRESEPDSDDVIKEAEDTEIKGLTLDISEFCL